MYLLRMIEALEGDYPAVAHFLGDEDFAEARRRGTSRRIRRPATRSTASASAFRSSSETSRGIRRKGFVADLARLELAVTEVFDAPESAAWPAEAITKIPEEAWPGGGPEADRRLPARRLRAIRSTRTSSRSRTRTTTIRTPAARRRYVAVWRKGFEVWRLDLSKPAYDFLGALAKGRPFGKAVEAAARGLQGNPGRPALPLAPRLGRRGDVPGGRDRSLSPRPALRLRFAHDPASTREWLEADGLGGFASGTASGDPDAALPRPAADGEEPSDGAHRPRQRLRRLRRDRGRTVRHLVAGVRARASSIPTAPSRIERLRARALAALDVRAARRHAPLAGDLRPEGRVGDGRRLEAPRGRRARLPRGPPVPLGPRLPRAPPREPGVSLRARRRRRTGRSGSSPIRTCPRSSCARTAPSFRPATGTATSSTPRRGRGASTSRRTWRRPRSSDSTSAARRSCSLAAEGHETRARIRRAPRPRSNRSGMPSASRRLRFADRLERAADAYLVRRGAGRTIIAGYPWFTDWGRDTFIALRGLCLATGRLAEAEGILLEWAGAVSEGMLPNRFPDAGRASPSSTRSTPRSGTSSPSTSSCETMAAAGRKASRASVATLRSRGRGDPRRLRARHALRDPGRRRRPAGRGRAGRAADVDGREGRRLGRHAAHRQAGRGAGAVAERAVGRRRRSRTAGATLHDRGLAAFHERFWNEAAGCLYDVVDADHRPGEADPTFRPNQIFAVGGLPVPDPRGRARAARRRRRRGEPRDAARPALALAGGSRATSAATRADPRERDGAYHQGTVWPWLAGAFVDAWVRVRGGTDEARREARRRFLEPLIAHLDEAGLGARLGDRRRRRAPYARGAARSRPGRSASCCASSG